MLLMTFESPHPNEGLNHTFLVSNPASSNLYLLNLTHLNTCEPESMLSHFMPLTMPCYSPTMSSPTTVSIDQSRFCPLKPRSNALPDTRLPHTFKWTVAVPSEILLRFCLIWPLFMFYFVFQLSVPLLLLYT